MSGVQTYWEASDWYGSVSIGDVVCSDLSLDDLVEHEVANAASDATLDSDDVRKWIVGAAEEWLKQHEDSEDDSDAKLRARLRCLLDADLE
jgi:predicted nucleotidyltransferase